MEPPVPAGACHRAGPTGPAFGRPDDRLRPDPLGRPDDKLREIRERPIEIPETLIPDGGTAKRRRSLHPGYELRDGGLKRTRPAAPITASTATSELRRRACRSPSAR